MLSSNQLKKMQKIYPKKLQAKNLCNFFNGIKINNKFCVFDTRIAFILPLFFANFEVKRGRNG
jgi:hypothetical protein